MVVLSVIGIILGVGLAFLSSASRDLEFRATIGQVRSLLRYARGEAVAQHSPAYVVVDPETREIRAVTKRTIGLWHFEDEKTTGAFGHDGKMYGGQIVPGKIGSALELSPKEYVDCGDLTIFRPDQGIVIEAWLCLNSRNRQSIFTCEGEYSLAIAKNGELVGQAGGKTAAAKGTQVPLHRWFEAVLAYDGKTLRLLQDDVEVGESQDDGKPGKLVDKGSHFVIGDPHEGLDGKVDELRVSAVLATETRTLPESIHVVGGKPVRICFDSRGRLDQRFHTGPVLFTLQWEKQSELFTVGWLGTLHTDSGEPIDDESTKDTKGARGSTKDTKDTKDAKESTKEPTKEMKDTKVGDDEKKGASK